MYIIVYKTNKIMKQTAVEWFFEQIMYADVDIKVWREILEQAKEMEKQQIINAYCAAENNSEFLEYEHRYGREYLTAEPYYNETFKNK